MDIRFCHPSDFSEFFKLKSAETCEFDGVFGSLINSILLSFLPRYNLTGFVDAYHGFGEQIGSNGSYNGCLGRLQRNQSDILLRFGDYPINCSNITQGDVFLETQLTFSQHYFHEKVDKKFQILSSLASLKGVLAYIILFFVTVIIWLKVARVLTDKMRPPPLMVRYTFGRRWDTIKVTNHNVINVFAHAFRLGELRARRNHTRCIFMSLSIFSLVLIHIFFTSIKTDLVVVDDPEYWKNYEEVMRNKIRPVFIEEMETIQNFKLAKPGSIEHTLWQYIVKNFDLKEVLIHANLDSFFKAGLEMQGRRVVIMLDEIMAKMLQNAGCSLNKYDYSSMLSGLKMRHLSKGRFFFYRVSSDPASKFIQRGVIFSEFFTSRAARIIKKFIKNSHENGITQRDVKVLMSENIIDKYVADLPLAGVDSGKISECMSYSVVKGHSEREKLVTLGNTVTLRIWYFSINFLALVVLIAEKLNSRMGKSRRTGRKPRHAMQ